MQQSFFFSVQLLRSFRRWALELIDKFGLGDGLLLRDAIQGPREIYKGSKSDHLRTISSKTGVPLEQMIFFDNEIENCRVVAGVGATVVYTPQGMTRKLFQEGLGKFPSPGKILGPTGK
jgi:hypothetical protein